MKTITLEWTTNPAPINIEFTFSHHNVAGRCETLRTFPTKKVRVHVPDEYTTDTIMSITNANTATEE